MEENILSEKEIIKRAKIKAKFEERRKRGYEKYLKRKRREIEKREAEKRKKREEEKLKKKLQREKEKAKNKGKKKVGRPKKTGPKINYYKRNKKRMLAKIPKVREKLPPFNYKIISCCNGIQNKFIGKYRNIEDAYEVFHDLKRQDDNVIFPTLIMGLGVLENSINEYILIGKQDDTEKAPPKLRNEYGKLVEQVINIDGWAIIDKFKYKKEETFWVYGYNKSNDRKPFMWIYENLIINETDNPYEFKRIFLFKNKIVIKNDKNKMDLIMCKHPSDAVRFYNKLEELIKLDKNKQIIFAGDADSSKERKIKMIDEIVALTGWTRKKAGMSTSSFNKSNKKISV